MGDLARTPAYANFRAWVPRNTVPVGASATLWTYYDWGPREYAIPLLCLHGAAGSADVFFAQVLGLATAGYRVLTAELPPYWSVAAAVDGLGAFLDTLRLPAVHLYGAGLGGFLGLAFAGRRPERVASLLLTHAFVATGPLRRASPYSPAVLRWLPEPLVRSAFAPLLPSGVAPLPVARSVEFVAARVATASRDALASRLALLAAATDLSGKLARVRPAAVTRVDSTDRRSPVAAAIDAALDAALPGARVAYLKGGGDFPYLSSPEGTTMHLVVHLRRHGAPPVDATALPPLP
ncbi:hypothetical protein BU14_0927s0003, partial [Porphyra umbilicalis]